MTLTATVAIIAAAILGAAGVAAAAASSHADAALLGPLSLIALTHAPALLAIALAAPATRSFAIALLFLGVGAAVFCADMAMRQYMGRGLLTMAAPVSGFLMMAGWLAVAIGALLAPKVRLTGT